MHPSSNYLFFSTYFTVLKEINEILGEKLSAEDEEEILAEFENLEAQVCVRFQLALKRQYVGEECLILYINYIYFLQLSRSSCLFFIINLAGPKCCVLLCLVQ